MANFSAPCVRLGKLTICQNGRSNEKIFSPSKNSISFEYKKGWGLFYFSFFKTFCEGDISIDLTWVLLSKGTVRTLENMFFFRLSSQCINVHYRIVAHSYLGSFPFSRSIYIEKKSLKHKSDFSSSPFLIPQSERAVLHNWRSSISDFSSITSTRQWRTSMHVFSLAATKAWDWSTIPRKLPESAKRKTMFTQKLRFCRHLCDGRAAYLHITSLTILVTKNCHKGKSLSRWVCFCTSRLLDAGCFAAQNAPSCVTLDARIADIWNEHFCSCSSTKAVR